MKGVCPECEQIADLETVRRDLEIVVRGEPVTVVAELQRCLSCGEEFKDLSSDVDVLDLAFLEYRTRHNMLMPEEIKGIRERYGLTQSELSALLGWGGATLSRYENGALQSEANDRMLRMLSEPGNLLTLIEEHPDALAEDKRPALIGVLNEQKEQVCSPGGTLKRPLPIIPGGPKTETLNIRVESQVKKKIEEYAAKTRVDVSDMVRGWIYDGLERDASGGRGGAEYSLSRYIDALSADVQEIKETVSGLSDRLETGELRGYGQAKPPRKPAAAAKKNAPPG